MSDVKRRFIRIYYTDLQRDYPEVWFDPTCLATYNRLLALADAAYPANPELYRAVRRADLALLEKVGLVTLLDHGLYAMKGYEKERSERSEKARQSVSSRYDRATTVERPYTETPSVELLRGARASVLDTGYSSVESGDAREANAWDAFASRTGEVPGPKIRSWLDELAEAHSEARLCSMLGRLPKTQRTSVDYLKAVRDALRAEDFEAEKAERVTEKAAVKAKRAPVTVIRPADDISPEEAKRLAAEYHAASKVPA